MESVAEEKERRAQSARMIVWFAGLLWRERPLAVAVNVSVMLVQGLIPAGQLLVTRRLLDVVAGFSGGGGDFRAMAFWIGALAAVSGLQAVLEAARQTARAFLRESAGVRLQQLVIEKSGRVPLEEFEHPAFHDRLQRACQAATWRSFVIFENFLRIAEIVVNLLSYLVLLVQAHFSLPAVLALSALPSLVSQLRRGEERYLLHRRQTPAQRRVNYLVELLTDRETAKELRLYQLGPFLIDEWHRAARALRDERLHLAREQQVKVGAARAVAILGLAGAVGILLWRAVTGFVSLGGFVALMQAATRFQNQLVQVLRQLGNLYEEALYLSDLKAFVEYERVEAGREAADASRPCRIDFENVSFAYPGGPEVLKDLSFTIYPGEKVALVGANGAGKTTLIKLLLGLYRPTRGRILVDGVDLAALDPESHRRRVAAVFQDYLRYQLTARDNIGFGQVERLGDDPAIREAAAKAGADSVIEELPYGLDTTLGRTFEGGKDLSGGQWQRIAIARAYFRDAKILVLDEPTAALDARAELEVFEQFRALAGDRTAVFVSHRMASARIADRILVLAGGRLIENGSHDELLAKGGEYARMFELQAQWYRSGDPAGGEAADSQSAGAPGEDAASRLQGTGEPRAAGWERALGGGPA